MTPPENLKGLVNILLGIINPLLLLLVGLALLFFFKGLLVFILKSGDEKALEEGKNQMKWGLIGLFLMVSLWGVLQFLYGNFFDGTVGFPLLPDGTT